MATFGAVKTAISRRLLDENNTAVTAVEVSEAINAAIQRWKQKRFWFNTTDVDLTIADGDTEVTLPADFLIDIPRNAFTITDSGMTYTVKKVSPLVFDSYANTAATGRPKIYCYRDGDLEFYPTADRDYDGKLYYIKDYNDFLTDTTQDNLDNDFLNEGLELIRNEALANLHGELRQDEKMEARYLSRRDAEYNSLLGRTNMLLKTGTLTVEQ